MSILLFNLGLFSLTRLILPEAEEICFLALLIGSVFFFSLRMAALASGLMMCALVHIYLYKHLSGLQFNLYQVFENPIDAGQSVILFLGNLFTILALMELTFLTVGLAAIVKWLLAGRRIPRTVWMPALVALSIPAITYASVVGTQHFYPRVPVRLVFQESDRPGVVPLSDESLIVLQLESVNSAVIFSGTTEPFASRIPLPGLQKVRDLGGLWIPHIWSNSFGTHLGMSSILCGTSGALTAQLVRPSDGTPCMPERFRRAGFDTTFYYSFRDADFYQMKTHVGALGFQNFYFGDALMKNQESNLKWGYQDCSFYKRAFDHMESSGLASKKKIFVYMSVHMHHAPFGNHLDIEHPFAKPATSEEVYLNSAFEQEHCMVEFIERVQQLKRNDLHVMIIGDHGFPVNKRWGTYDHFATSYYFLPSRQRRSEFKSGDRSGPQIAQDQIISTVLELFGTPPSPTSFLWALKGEAQPANYRKCLLISEFGHDMAIALEGQRQVTRKLRRDSFSGAVYANRQPIQEKRLHSSRDWADYQLDPACMQQLGAPGY